MLETFPGFIDLFIHLDKYLPAMVASYGNLIYGILFVIIFCETGLVVTPFLPGDSLLFISGTVAAVGGLNISILLVLITSAAIIGDNVNYFIGRFVGQKILELNLPMIKKEHLDKTHEYFEKYGPLTIIVARFAPFVRTFTPFIAGMGAMEYKKFLPYDICGGILWVCTFTLAGYFLGTIPVIKENMSLVALIIIVISLGAVGSILLEIIRFLKNCITCRRK
ncbi:MAG TPA: VTT domain-containing protein [Methanospirillum sp.]|uniref:VTT domain-containing protein n=1 Tax=Methanospirillum sp. TaxID=45200 RepID=UPI002D1D618B|nr:VTT domain-containing protein [Methanospirillum sp.]HWQ65075.1 VTT domain-containing protein [Methanospirillum sp.]